LRRTRTDGYVRAVETLWWTLTILLMAAGLLGAVFPVLPDSLLILAGAFLHHFTVRPEHSVDWWMLGVLTLLMILAHVVDIGAGAVGAKRYGASKWGAVGGLVGAIVGTLLFFPWGIFLGPVVGVLVAEIMFARKALGPAVKSSWGTLLGTAVGIVGKVIIDVSMVVIFFAWVSYQSGWFTSSAR
jgi:uncharacterized protein YqgC (DUF456 family)